MSLRDVRAWLWQRRTPMALAAYIGINLGLSAYSVNRLPLDPDWALWSALPSGLEEGSIYGLDTEAPFVWSPVMAWIMAGVVTFIGFWPWAVLHAAAVFLIGHPLTILLTLVSWGFWLDLAGGNTFTFVFVAAVLAIRGSTVGSHGYLILSLLMPRPVQVPLGIWLLARRPELRIPFLGYAVAHGLIVLVSGHASEWIEAMWAYGQSHQYDVGPGRWLGSGWLLIGLPVALWFGIRGRLGFAGVAASPYLLPQYLLMPLLELVDRREHRHG